VPDKHAQIMHPGCRKNNIVVIDLAFTDLARKQIKARLVAVFVRWISVVLKETAEVGAIGCFDFQASFHHRKELSSADLSSRPKRSEVDAIANQSSASVPAARVVP